jgi:hypothetical protein
MRASRLLLLSQLLGLAVLSLSATYRVVYETGAREQVRAKK